MDYSNSNLRQSGEKTLIWENNLILGHSSFGELFLFGAQLLTVSNKAKIGVGTLFRTQVRKQWKVCDTFRRTEGFYPTGTKRENIYTREARCGSKAARKIVVVGHQAETMTPFSLCLFL